MKKWLSLLLCISGAITLLKAQDIIVRKDSSELRVRLMEITSTSIKYKRIDYPDGPLFLINTSDIFMVKYANGTADTMHAAQDAPVLISKTSDGRITQAKHGYYLNGIMLTRQTFYPTIYESRNEDAIRALKWEKRRRRTGQFMIGIGIPIISTGFTILTIGAAILNNSRNGGRPASDGGVVLAIGVGLTGIGGTLISQGITKKNSSVQFRKLAVDAYNRQVAREQMQKK